MTESIDMLNNKYDYLRDYSHHLQQEVKGNWYRSRGGKERIEHLELKHRKLQEDVHHLSKNLKQQQGGAESPTNEKRPPTPKNPGDHDLGKSYHEHQEIWEALLANEALRRCIYGHFTNQPDVRLS